MCGIVGAVAERDVVPILIEGLKRLEYRGYDSAGVVVLDEGNQLERVRAPGKVREVEALARTQHLRGTSGIAHTRWATHGKPTQANAHPHICRKTVAVVHNGIIENHENLRAFQRDAGYEFTSETDTEVVVHQVHYHLAKGLSLLNAVQATVKELHGAYALGVVSNTEPGVMIATRRGSPLVIGVGIGEHFIASDVAALIPVTQRFIFLEDGDVAEITRDSLTVFDANGNVVERPLKVSELTSDAVERGQYRHYMLKEIFEQPRALAETLEGRIGGQTVLDAAFGPGAADIFNAVQGVHIIACGTSFHAGQVARYWFESLAGIPCSVEVASEFRYRRPVVRRNSLVVAISQSGETADTLAALQEAKLRGFGASLAICNVPESSLVRACDLALMTRAGPEIGVASTKCFTTQLAALLMLALYVGRKRGTLSAERTAKFVEAMAMLPGQMRDVLAETKQLVSNLARRHGEARDVLFLGRGFSFPIALEGALKLKEISYVHAEGYAAGEMKHGPIALIDSSVPVFVIVPHDSNYERTLGNLQEAAAREAKVIAITTSGDEQVRGLGHDTIEVPEVMEELTPFLTVLPLQLYSYYVADHKGTDIDQPRNLAKTVTVE